MCSADLLRLSSVLLLRLQLRLLVVLLMLLLLPLLLGFMFVRRLLNCPLRAAMGTRGNATSPTDWAAVARAF